MWVINLQRRDTYVGNKSTKTCTEDITLNVRILITFRGRERL